MKLLDFPELRQTYRYDCGAKALQAVLAYYGIEIREELIMKYAKTNSKEGTLLPGMLSVLKKHSLTYDSRKMTLKDVTAYINNNIPVIILVQAWSGKSIDYTNDYHDGHWVVAIGYDTSKIVFEDPYSFKRTYIENKELETRWHSEEDGKKIINHGIAVFGKKSTYNSGNIVHMD